MPMGAVMNQNLFRSCPVFAISRMGIATCMASLFSAASFPRFFGAAPKTFTPRPRLLSYHTWMHRSFTHPSSSSPSLSSFAHPKGNDFVHSDDKSPPLATDHSSSSKLSFENTHPRGKPAPYTEHQQTMSLLPSDDAPNQLKKSRPLENKVTEQMWVKKYDKSSLNHEVVSEPEQKELDSLNTQGDTSLLSSKERLKFLTDEYERKRERMEKKHLKKYSKPSMKHEVVLPHDRELDFLNLQHENPSVSYKEGHRFFSKDHENKRHMMHKKHLQIRKKKSKLHNQRFTEKHPSPSRPFDICYSGNTISDIFEPVPNSPPHLEGEFGFSFQPRHPVLRRGMVLLKNYLSSTQQVEIVKQCREFGLRPGGFYRPEYKDGRKLHLQMMCLGLSWDPQKRAYSELHPVDNSETPKIPEYFSGLVKDAICFSHEKIRETETDGIDDMETILPVIDPNICIVNFYETTGKLGLHQDGDESKESLEKGLPVVSFSIGDFAEFSFGDERDAYKAEYIVLESGDVLIFGGDSRHIYHGVSSILPDTAPCFLRREANLRPGRLNLTFRQY